MSSQPTPTTPPQARSSPLMPSPRPPRFANVRGWLRGRWGRIVVPIIALILGFALGITALFVYGLSGEGTVMGTPAPGKQDIVVEADKAFLTNLVKYNLQHAGMPGTIQNVTVVLATGDQMTISGDDTFGVLGLGVTKHFQLVVQPYIASCVLQVHVVHADLSGIPVTGLAQTFESQTNQQLAQKPSGLPKDFQYCASSVRTEPGGIFVAYSATPLAMNGAVFYA
ncbi:MAG TPA: hypothetical protein VGT44_20730 [Ktedonobacteraceae bacterium]|nr:hypothetical protein [Ktedonobacteraceae bacterium]